MVRWTDLGTLLSTLAVLCSQQRWWRVPGKTSSMARQKPSAPSPTAISGAMVRPAPLHLDQQLAPALGALANPDLEADEFLLPLGRGADQTSMHSAWLSIRACR
jgi:hypothetical protein